MTRLPVLLAALALSLPTASGAQAQAWRTSWAAPPAPAMAATAGPPARPGTPVFDDQTIVQEVRLSAGGRRLRLRLSNVYGAAPLVIDHVRVALRPGGGAQGGAARDVTFSGAPTAHLAPHAPLVSDPVDLPVGALATVSVSLHTPGRVEACTCHVVGLQAATVTPPLAGAAASYEGRAFLTAVDVEGETRRPEVVALGDSITDGYRSTAGADRRWPDRLAERLVQAHRDTAVANEGLSGNRVLSDGVIPVFGESALARFDRDVLGRPGVTHLIVLEGINDLGGKPTPSADALIGGYRQLIARAHAHGIRVIMGTLPPYEGAAYFRPEGEAAREAVNAWIRTETEADGVVDFDRVMRDPAHPARLRADLQSGDWLHPNDAGYRAMGDAVPLALIR